MPGAQIRRLQNRLGVTKHLPSPELARTTYLWRYGSIGPSFVRKYFRTIILPEVLHYLRSNSFEGTFVLSKVLSKVRVLSYESTKVLSYLRRYATTFVRYLYTYTYVYCTCTSGNRMTYWYYETFAVSWARAHNLPLKVRKYRTFVRTEVLSYNNTSGSITLSSFELLRRYFRKYVYFRTFEGTQLRYLYTYTCTVHVRVLPETEWHIDIISSYEGT